MTPVNNVEACIQEQHVGCSGDEMANSLLGSMPEHQSKFLGETSRLSSCHLKKFALGFFLQNKTSFSMPQNKTKHFQVRLVVSNQVFLSTWLNTAASMHLTIEVVLLNEFL